MALEYLVNKGYSLVERNYRTRYGEIDLILRSGDALGVGFRLQSTITSELRFRTLLSGGEQNVRFEMSGTPLQ